MNFDANDDVFQTVGNVSRIRTALGPIYRIKARVLPFLTGFLYLLPVRDVASINSSICWTLIDSGCGDSDCNGDIADAFQTIHDEFEQDFTPDKIKRILLTHAHIDHFGGASELRRQTNAEIFIHAFESSLVLAYDDRSRVENCRYEYFLLEAGVAPNLVQMILDGFGFRPGRTKNADSVRSLLGGEYLGPIRTLYLPGHSAGHLAFLYGNVIFSGDLLLSKTLTQIWPTRMTPQTGILNYVWSLKKLEKIALDFERQTGRKLLALPAHEDPIFDIPHRADQALRSMERRNRRLLTLLEEAEHPMTLAEITRQMYWNGRPNREFFALSDVGSRVEYLLQLGLIRLVETEKVCFDSPILRYDVALPNVKTNKNTIEQIFDMNQIDCASYTNGNDVNYSGE